VARSSDGVRALVDLSFCLALIREGGMAGAGGLLLSALQEHAPGEVGICASTVADLLRRAAASRDPARNRAALEQFLLPLQVVNFDAPAAACLAELGVRIAPGSESAFAAASALALDARLMTCAPQRYTALHGLRVDAFALPHEQTSLPMPRPGNLILAMGSHDLTLELVGDHLHAAHPEVLFCSAHVGSMGGLHALLNGDAHLAGVHLLDEESGEYNEPALRALFVPQGRHAVLVAFVQRIQGLMVAPGNAHRLRTIGEVVERGARFVNRQSGSGTRLLLDRELRTQGIAAARLRGYDDVEQSHSAVAAAIAAGRAECGLGIEAAARARGLDFVPLFKERYDLAIPGEHFASARLASLLALLRRPGPRLLRAIHALGGYTTEAMGQVLAEC